MQAGKLNCLVAIQSLTVGQDGIGQPTQVWSTVAAPWANIRYLNGLETIKADGVTPIAKASIRIRRRTDVTPAMRVVYGAAVFEIKAVLPDEENRERTDLVCEVVGV